MKQKKVVAFGEDFVQVEMTSDNSPVVWVGIHSETRGFSEIPILRDDAELIIHALQEVCY